MAHSTSLTLSHQQLMAAFILKDLNTSGRVKCDEKCVSSLHSKAQKSETTKTSTERVDQTHLNSDDVQFV